MKIVHCVYSLDMGGAEMLVAQLCREQRKLGHDVSILSYARLGSVGAQLRGEGFTIYVPGEAHPIRTILRYTKWLRRVKPDAVHCHNPGPTIHGALAARLAGARSVVSTRHSLVEKPYDASTEWKFNLFASFCTAVAGVCDITCANLRAIPFSHKKKIVRVYNGAARVSADGGTPGKDGFTMLFLGRLEPVKHLSMLLRSFALAHSALPGLRLWIVGDGSCRQDLEKMAIDLQIDPAVKFWGLQIEPDRFLRAADAFVMTSDSEGLPMSLLQAMSAGVPAITTDVGGMAEVIRLAGCGLLVPVREVHAMSAAMVQLAQQAELRTSLALKAKSAYEREFTLEAMTLLYMRLYSQPDS